MADETIERPAEDTKEQRRRLDVIERRGRKQVEKRTETLKVLQIEYVSVDVLQPNPYNPNRQSDHEFELLMRSMEEDGFTQPVVAVRATPEIMADEKFSLYQEGDCVIVDGEHRWRAARRLGLTEIPVVFVTMSIEQMRIATLRHNRARGSEDVELVADVLRDLRELGALDWAADSLMMDDVEMQRLLEDMSAVDALAADEYSQGWAPDPAVGSNNEIVDPEGTVLSRTPAGEEGAVMHASTAASDAVRAREKAVAGAKREEEAESIRRHLNRDFYKITLLYHGDEAKIVRAALSGAAADTILSWCVEDEASIGELNGKVRVEKLVGLRLISPESAAAFRAAMAEAKKRGALATGTGAAYGDALIGLLAEAYLAAEA